MHNWVSIWKRQKSTAKGNSCGTEMGEIIGVDELGKEINASQAQRSQGKKERGSCQTWTGEKTGAVDNDWSGSIQTALVSQGRSF